MPLRALLFDLDGTLLDTNDQHARAWQRALDHLGYRVPAERILLEIGKGGDRVVPSLIGEEAEARHGEELRSAQSAAYRRIVGSEGVASFPQAQALVEACRARDLQTALVTGSGADDLDDVFAQTSLSREALFDAVITGDDVDAIKPAPSALRAALDALGVHPGRAAMVGDTPYDMEAARRAGLAGVGVLTGAHPSKALHAVGARATYDDVSVLLDHFEEALHRVAPGRKPLTPVYLSDLMQDALDEAWAGLSEGELPVGSVIAGGNGRVIGRGRNRAYATGSRVAHAEMMALADAAGALKPRTGAILATTVEPCAMCLSAVMEAGIDTVVYAVSAPSNGGAARITPPDRASFPRLIGGVRVEGSQALLRRWLDRHPDDAFAEELLGEERVESAA